MDISDYDNFSKFGTLRSVIDPNDEMGLKNILIDQIHWIALRRNLVGSKKLLDFGCGIGRLANRIERMKIQYTGIDISQGMIEMANKLNKNSQFSNFDGVHIPFPDATFDTVVTTYVYIYILKTSDSQAVLSEIRRVLVPEAGSIMLEQASLSGSKSGTVNSVLTEKDYIVALSDYFLIHGLYKVRSSDFSKLFTKLIDSKKIPIFLFRLFVDLLARIELNRITKASDEYFASVHYYDILIKAISRNK